MSTPPLLDLLGAHWALDAPVVALAWAYGDETVACALGDGQLALARAHWPRGPRIEPRPGGGVALTPATEPAPPPDRATCHTGGCLSLVADAEGGFLSGGDDGRVVMVPRTGAPVTLSHTAGAWVQALALASHPDGLRARALGRQVVCERAGQAQTLDLPAPATAMGFSPDGQHLAIAHSGGLTLWSLNAPLRRLAWPGYHRAIAWSPDGRYVVTGMQENALHGWRVADGGDIEMGGYPGQPLSLSFSHDGRHLVTSGGTRPVCWGFDPPGGPDQPSECALASKTPVSCVSCHPRQTLIAAGYHNGAVLLCQPKQDAVLFIKGSGGGAVNALAWSGDGSRLAFGTQQGLCGWLPLPDTLFRARQRAPGQLQETSP